jgi:hypothetical protein
MNKYIVKQKWTTIYNNPIVLNAGQEIKIDNTKKEENHDWFGWVWCISDDNEGWIPIQILNIIEQGDKHSKALVEENYSAKEINADIGDIVFGDKVLNGWLWCKKKGTEDYGWLPLQNLSKKRLAYTANMGNKN